MDTQAPTRSIPIAVPAARKLDSKENLAPDLKHTLPPPPRKAVNRKGTLSRQSGRANILEAWPDPGTKADADTLLPPLPARPPSAAATGKKPRPKSAAYENISVPTGLSIGNPARRAKSTSSVKKKLLAGTSRPHVPETAARQQQYRTVYPNFRQSDRRAPLIDENGLPRRIVTHHTGTVRALAAANGARVATGSFTVKIWDTASCQAMQTIAPAMLHGNAGYNASPQQQKQQQQDNDMDGTERVSSLAFAPSRSMQDIGRYLWAGLSDGHVVIFDTWLSRPFSFRRHERSVKFILQVQNTEMWTLDSEGVLNRWPLPHAGEDMLPDLMCTDGYHHRVTPCAVAATVVAAPSGKDYVLWITSGRTLDIYHFPSCHSEHPQITITRPHRVLCVPNELSSVTQMQVLPNHRIACAHDDGHVSIWDTRAMKLLYVAVVSMYGITAMVLTQGRYLWTAHRTGRMQIFDIGSSQRTDNDQEQQQQQQWVAIKHWEAHQAPILKLVLDETGLLTSVKNNHVAPVVSVDAHGTLAIWDGLLKQHWIDQELRKQEDKYCIYRETRILMCTWNIGACKPDSFDKYDEDKVHEWLGSIEDPDFIVIGLQEMVDLESKRQTARSILFKRKKTNSVYNEHQHTRQHERWRTFLTGVICDNYGDVYRLEKTEYLVGLYSLVFAKSEDRHRISDIQSMIIKTGVRVMNKSWHGNKGATAIRMVVDGDSLCFVNCHLAAGQSRVSHRNADTEAIFKAAKFRDNRGILDHDHCFLSGDLNYRIDHFSRAQIEDRLLVENQLESLLEHDQLSVQRKTNPLLKLLLFDEAPITFKPTYKYDPGTDVYDSSEKQRLPAWCDRILFKSPRVKYHYYTRHEVLASDHRPVSAGLSVDLRNINYLERDRILHRLNLCWRDEQLKCISQNVKTRHVASFQRCSQEDALNSLECLDWDVEAAVSRLYSRT